MDLVGPISPQMSKGNRYMMTVIDMLTGYTIAVPITDKRSETVCKAYRDSVYCIFGGSSRILTDNGTEFKSKEMKQIFEDLDIKQVISPVYTPQANGHLEGWHRFLKVCIAKHIRGTDMEWDDLIPLAASAYNFFPCQSSKEAPFVLMFGRDPITPIAKLLEPKLKFYGEKGTGVNLNMLRSLYVVVAENIHKAREKQPRQETAPPKLQVNDLVLVKDPESAAFDSKYMPNYRVTAVYGRNRIEVQDEKGNKSVRRAAHVKVCEPVDWVISQLPPQSVYEQYGRSSKLLIHPKDVPEIPLELFGGHRYQEEPGKFDICEESKNREGCGGKVNKQSQKNSCVIKPTGSKPTTSDTIDESRSREQYGVCEEINIEECDVNMLTTDLTQTVIDSSDELRNRSNVTKLDGNAVKTKADVRGESLGTQDDIDTNDTSRNRIYKSTLGVMYDSMQEPLKMIDDGTDVAEQGNVEQLWTPRSTECESDKESSSRHDRCSMSAYQQTQQSVTPVVDSGSIGPTVVNIHDIDKCLVTNKHTNVKQDSISTSNQWLSNTFSMITSGILGKSKIKTGKEVTENVDTNSKTKLVFKPEFNFFL